MLPSPTKKLACLLISATGVLQAADRIVTSSTDGAAGSLRQVISTSAKGDRILFDPSLSGQTLTLTSGEISLTNRTLIIDGSGLASAVTLAGKGTSSARIFSVNNSSIITLDSLVLAGGKGVPGGAISNTGNLTIRRCTFRDNQSDYGGAINNLEFANGSLLVENSTFTANTATVGGAICHRSFGSFELRGCTISKNSASNTGGGIYSTQNFTARESVIAGNTAPLGSANVEPPSRLTPTGTGAANLIGGDPVLAPLGQHGGPVPTLFPLAGSPVVDPPTNPTTSPLTTDQRGLARVTGPSLDSGAVEWDPASSFVQPANGATGAALGLQPVIWSTEADADSFEIFLGTSSGALSLVGSTTVGRFDLPLPGAGTTYYWRVDALRGTTRTTGTEQSLTTRMPIQVTTLLDENDGSPDPGMGAGTSLREAILAANATPGGDRILFSPSLAGGTIVLGGSELAAVGNVEIDAGSLASPLTLFANRQSRIISMAAEGTETARFLLRNLKLTGGKITGSGAGVSAAGLLIVDRCEISDNEATSTSAISASSLDIRTSSIEANISTGSFNGAVRASQLVMRDCTVAGNFAKENSTCVDILTGGTIENATISDNMGVGIRKDGAGALVIRHVTLTRNRASFSGGLSISSGAVTVENSIIADNRSNDSNPDLRGTPTLLGVNLIGGDPKLAPLGNYGGPTKTSPPAIGSPAINPAGGATSSSLATDQRGTARPQHGIVDVGAVEFAAGASAVPADGTGGVTSYLASLYWTTGFGANSHQIYLGTAAGQLTPVGTTSVGMWTLELLEPETTYYWRVDSTTGGVTTPGVVRSFTTRPALQVTTAADEDNGTANPAIGSGTSLREAVAAAALGLGGDTVRFAPSLDGALIVLGGTSITVPDGVRIDASPLSGGLTISANRASGVLQIPELSQVVLQGLTIRDGARVGSTVTPGVSNDGSLTMSRCIVTANHDGGVKSYNTLVMDECLIHRNFNTGFSGSGTALLRRSTISGNYDTANGGILYSDGDLTLEQCTVVSNRSNYSTSAISSNGGDVTLRQCTVLGNSIGSSYSSTVGVSGARLTLENSIVVGKNFASTTSASDLVQLGTNHTSGDPKLAPLGYYGGPTPTCPPVAGSPAIDPAAGTATSSLSTDQRGLPRVAGTKVDIGAAEYSPAIPAFPVDEAMDTPSYRVPLCWAAVPGATSYQVYLGTSAGSLQPAGVTSSGLWVVEILEPGTTWFWRVDAVVGATTVTGTVRSFTTRPAKLVTTAVDESDLPFIPGTGLSLREALVAAAERPDGELIRFAPAFDGTTVSSGGTPLTMEGVVAIDATPLPHGISISGALKSNALTVPQCADAFLTACTVRDGGFDSGVAIASGSGIRNFGHLTLSRCSVVYNRASSDGGGIYSEGTLRISNSTIAENRADYGGGIANDGVMVLENTTISANHAKYSHGGIYAPYAEKNHLINTIVAGHPHGGNLHGNVHQSGGVNFLAGEPRLAPLGYYGGPTPTMPPLAGAPVIDPAGGMATSVSPTDQRGQPRVVSGVLDIGAVEWSAAPARFPADGATGIPARHATLYWNALPSATSHEVFIGTSAGSLASAGVTTSGSFELASLTLETTYFWRVDSTEGGVTTPGTVWQFTTRAAHLVTTAGDTTTGTSLRAILTAVRLADGGDVVQFAPSLAGTTITLSGTPLLIDDDVLIDAMPLAEGPVISGAALSGVFEVGTFATAEFAGFTITRGRATSGGGIRCEHSDLSLMNMTLSKNEGTSSGGGLFARGGKIKIGNSTIEGNQADDCGGICVTSGSAELINTTVANNKGTDTGGGIGISFSPLLLRHVTVTGNQASSGGGLSGNSSTTLEGSIIAGNIAPAHTNLDFTPTGAVSCLIGGNPRLAPLARYGGRTPVMPPLPGSPAINLVAPVASTPLLDQRGALRPVGPAADAGAVEAFPFITLPRIDSDGDGIDDRLEPALGLNVGQNDSGRDSDGDGDSDAKELDSMTDPQNSRDYFRIVSTEGAPGNLEIRFSSFPGMGYRLARSSDLVTFTPVAGSNITATGAITLIEAPNDPAPAYFRVEHVPIATP